MLLRLTDDQIGKGVVHRGFTARGVYLRRGTELTREQVLDINPVNRQAMIDKSFLHVFPRAEIQEPEPMDRHVVSLGFGKFDVVEGVKLNDAPLTKEAAYALAGVELQAPDTAKPARRRN